MKVKQGKVLHWFVEKPRVERGQTCPPLGPAGISQGLLAVQVMALIITIMMRKKIFLRHSGCIDDNKNVNG